MVVRLTFGETETRPTALLDNMCNCTAGAACVSYWTNIVIDDEPVILHVIDPRREDDYDEYGYMGSPFVWDELRLRTSKHNLKVEDQDEELLHPDFWYDAVRAQLKENG